MLASGQSAAAPLAAAPALVTTAPVQRRPVAQLTPEPYAAARQIEAGLALAVTGRGAAFAPNRDKAGPFTSGTALAAQRALKTDIALATAHLQTNGYASWPGWALPGRAFQRRYAPGELGLEATLADKDCDATTSRVATGGAAFGPLSLQRPHR